jgi:nucleotide-binding universal stress UspA family protein
MRSILINADRSPCLTDRLATGLSLARLTGGHVTVMIASALARYIAIDPTGGSYLAAEAMQRALADDGALAEALDQRLRGQDVAYDVVRSEYDAMESLDLASRLCDVIVVSRGQGNAGQLAIMANAPVLVVPDDSKGGLGFPLRAACIAWDGSNEAAAALRSAVPILQGCDQVSVLTVTEKPGGFAALEAMAYLSRHGIKAELAELAPQGSTQETLARAVRDRNAGLLVMGAYGKSRMREYLFGGVTQYFLTEASAPALLLAH